MIDIRKLLTRKAVGSADLAASAAEARTESQAAASTLARLTEERRGLLLTADDAAVAAHDAGILAAQRQRDRADAVASELEKRRAEALETEAEATRRMRFEAATLEVERGTQWLREAYPMHAGEIARGLGELRRLEGLIDEVNNDLPRGGTPFLPLEYVVRRGLGGGALPLTQTVALPALASDAVDLWPPPASMS